MPPTSVPDTSSAGRFDFGSSAAPASSIIVANARMVALRRAIAAGPAARTSAMHMSAKVRPSAVAVRQPTGDVFVADSGHPDPDTGNSGVPDAR
ncbi:MAG TPA: hypothetical protein VI318_06235 [Baekduia sp.]